MLIRHADMVRYIKAQRIRWIGHIVKMVKERTVKTRIILLLTRITSFHVCLRVI